MVRSISSMVQTLNYSNLLLSQFNHSFDSKLQYGSSGKDVAIVSLPASEKESVVITAGSQVFVNYGPLANATLMHLKGFAVSPNPYDHVELLMAMDPRSESYNDKVRMLKQAGIDQPNGPYFLKCAAFWHDFSVNQVLTQLYTL
jgi:hypothetical protein